MTESRLIIAAESRLFREGLKHVLTGGAIEIAAEVASLSDALVFLRSSGQSVGLLLHDLAESPMDSFEALKELTQEFPELGVVVLAERISATDLDMSVACGARAFLPKDISAAALCLSLRLIALGENLFAAPASLAQRGTPTAEMSDTADTLGLRIPLSLRERQILGCLEKGAPNKVIARDLDMAEATVKVHIKAVLRKIDVSNRTQAAVWAMNHQSFKNEMIS